MKAKRNRYWHVTGVGNTSYQGGNNMVFGPIWSLRGTVEGFGEQVVPNGDI
jgi:hypothetical protein